MAELLDKMQKLEVATFIRNEVKNFAYKNGFASKVVSDIYLVETEDSWSVSIPESISRTKLTYKKGSHAPKVIKLEEGKTFLEQAIINGVKKYLATIQAEGRVTVQ